jgi:hypothetical protein
VIIVSGMGHYESRTVNGNEMKWNDAEEITKILNNI